MSDLLNVEIKDNKLVISIGVDLLCHAEGLNLYYYKISNKIGFAKDIVNELLNEEEDGTTLVHRMFDEAANNAIENGSENVKEIENV